MRFICLLFHLFSHIVQVLSHATHCSGHKIYAFVRIMDCLVQSPNWLTLLVNYPNEAKIINIYFCRTLANFWNIILQPIILLKSPMNSSCNLQKVCIVICGSSVTEINFWWKRLLIISLYLPDGSFQIITRNE